MAKRIFPNFFTNINLFLYNSRILTNFKIRKSRVLELWCGIDQELLVIHTWTLAHFAWTDITPCRLDRVLVSGFPPFVRNPRDGL